MLNEWFEKDYFLYVCAGLCGAGFLIKMITNLVYWRLVKASENMSTSKNKLAKAMKLKFEALHKLKIGVNNVDIFVDKYVCRYKFCGILLSTWDNLGGLMFILCLLTGVITGVLGLIQDCGISTILSTLFAGMVSASVLLIVDNFLNVSSKKNRIKINMKDYFENFLQARLEQEALDPEAFEQMRTELMSKNGQAVSARQVKKEQRKQEKKQREQEKLLAIEKKQQEREDKKREKFEAKQAAIARRESERLEAEEQRRLEAEQRAEEKRRAIEERNSKRKQKQSEESVLSERLRAEAEEKAAYKRQENERRLEEEIRRHEELKKQEEMDKQERNRQAAQTIHEQAMSKEIAATKDRKDSNVKLDKAKERHDRLKEEIMATREQRNRELAQGKDPFDTFEGTKSVDAPNNYHVNDFNMDYELRVKAAEREEWKRKNEEAAVSVDAKNSSKVAPIDNAASFDAKQNLNRKAGIVKGNSPYEDKVIGEILKEFLA